MPRLILTGVYYARLDGAPEFFDAR